MQVGIKLLERFVCCWYQVTLINRSACVRAWLQRVKFPALFVKLYLYIGKANAVNGSKKLTDCLAQFFSRMHVCACSHCRWDRAKGKSVDHQSCIKRTTTARAINVIALPRCNINATYTVSIQKKQSQIIFSVIFLGLMKFIKFRALVPEFT